MTDEIYIFNERINELSPIPKDPAVAMAYVPFQNDDKLYSKEQGFVAGTMFPVLNKPFKECADRK